MRRFALLALVACTPKEVDTSKLDTRIAAAEQRLVAIEQRGAVDSRAVASELLAKGSA